MWFSIRAVSQSNTTHWRKGISEYCSPTSLLRSQKSWIRLKEEHNNSLSSLVYFHYNPWLFQKPFSTVPGKLSSSQTLTDFSLPPLPPLICSFIMLSWPSPAWARLFSRRGCKWKIRMEVTGFCCCRIDDVADVLSIHTMLLGEVTIWMLGCKLFSDYKLHEGKDFCLLFVAVSQVPRMVSDIY